MRVRNKELRQRRTRKEEKIKEAAKEIRLKYGEKGSKPAADKPKAPKKEAAPKAAKPAAEKPVAKKAKKEEAGS